MSLRSAVLSVSGREVEESASLGLDTTAQLFEMLQTMLAAGVPLAQALDGLRRQAELSRPLERTLRAVESGHSLSRAFALGGFTDPMVLSLLQLGERTGTMDKVVAELATAFRWRSRLRAELRSRLAYPVILAVACALLVGLGPPLLLRPILDFLQTSGATLPLATRALLGFIELLSAPWFWPPFLALLAAVASLGRRRYRQAPLVAEGWLIRQPVLGPCLRQLYTARFGRAMLAGLASGYPLLGAIELAASCSGSGRVQEQSGLACHALRMGETPESAFAALTDLDPLLRDSIPLGLSLGAVEGLLGAVLRLTEEKLRYRIEALLALLEPILLAFMGGLVALCILATVSPMMSLLQAVS